MGIHIDVITITAIEQRLLTWIETILQRFHIKSLQELVPFPVPSLSSLATLPIMASMPHWTWVMLSNELIPFPGCLIISYLTRPGLNTVKVVKPGTLSLFVWLDFTAVVTYLVDGLARSDIDIVTYHHSLGPRSKRGMQLMMSTSLLMPVSVNRLCNAMCVRNSDIDAQCYWPIGIKQNNPSFSGSGWRQITFPSSYFTHKTTLIIRKSHHQF